MGSQSHQLSNFPRHSVTIIKTAKNETRKNYSFSKQLVFIFVHFFKITIKIFTQMCSSVVLVKDQVDLFLPWPR